MRAFQHLYVVGLIAAGLLMVTTHSQAQDKSLPGMSEPAPGMTKGEGMAAFGKALLIDCLGSLEQGKAIANLSDTEKQDLRPASPEERQFQRVAEAVPVWTSNTMGSHLSVIETSAFRCDVRADQLPVEATFRQVLDVSSQILPRFRIVPQKPGYNPIVYQLEADKDGAHYLIHMEGAEPGGFGHASRFSLLLGWVERRDLK